MAFAFVIAFWIIAYVLAPIAAAWIVWTSIGIPHGPIRLALILAFIVITVMAVDDARSRSQAAQKSASAQGSAAASAR